MKKIKYFLILHNIRSAYNVGSIFRTADAGGISRIFLTGYTPVPTDKFGRETGGISKTALGAEKNIPWEYFSQPAPLIKKLKKQNIQIIGVEQAQNSVDYKKIKIKKPVAFVFGNEVRGLSKSLLKQCDLTAEIPMRGKKESLNVSVAAGIALFSILDI
ncbi:MAG: RNA methyltransferase [Candidatus Pacebacteria bacterium]|nr:RNA methyltransferase [Candidatus Paceibacterota bacterium]